MSGSSTAHLRADELDVEFDRLYLRHYRDVFRYSLVLLRDASDAEDVTGEVFERGLRSWRAGRRPTGEPLP